MTPTWQIQTLIHQDIKHCLARLVPHRLSLKAAAMQVARDHFTIEVWREQRELLKLRRELRNEIRRWDSWEDHPPRTSTMSYVPEGPH